MYLLYLDESGNPDDPADRHFVLGGAAVFERQPFFLAGELDGIQARYFPGLPPVEFHASHIRAGKGFWRGVERDVKDAVLRDLGDVIARAYQGFALFAAVVEKTETLYGEEAVRRATEEVCRAFDIFLMRRYKEANDPQRGLLVLAEGRFHQRSRTWVQGFRELGTRWGILRNLCDIPYFASSRETRMLQLADYVSHATFLLYEDRNASLIRPFLHRFDTKEGTLYGLQHVTATRRVCDCPGCHSRRIPRNNGPWLEPGPEGPAPEAP